MTGDSENISMECRNGPLLYLTEEQIEEFCTNGVLVVPGVLSPEELENAQSGLHECLLKYGCNVDDLKDTAANLKKLSSTGGAGGILDLFYEDFKLRLNESEKVFSVVSDIWSRTYSKGNRPNFTHPFGTFDPRKAYMYIDRVCYRVADEVAEDFLDSKQRPLQRSLTPHLDCCPNNLYDVNKPFPKWRPVQAFLALTDTVSPNEGGFEACLGHHRVFDEWVKNRKGSITKKKRKDGTIVESMIPAPCVGEFSPIRPVEDADIMNNMTPISCRAGDMILFDYRIPHANSRFNQSHRSREVVYLGFLPPITRNLSYAQEQLRRFRQGILPCDQWHESHQIQKCNYEFSDFGKKLMTISSWNS